MTGRQGWELVDHLSGSDLNGSFKLSGKWCEPLKVVTLDSIHWLFVRPYRVVTLVTLNSGSHLGLVAAWLIRPIGLSKSFSFGDQLVDLIRHIEVLRELRQAKLEIFWP